MHGKQNVTTILLCFCHIGFKSIITLAYLPGESQVPYNIEKSLSWGMSVGQAQNHF